MSVKQSIKVTNAGLSPILSVAQGTGAIEYEFTVSDFDIPSGSAAVAYNIQPTGNIVSQTCSISGNTITVKPPAYYFLRGKNYMQFQVSRNNEDLFSFLIEVWCAPNISQPEVIVAENPSLVSQLISDVGLLSAQLDNLLSIPSGSLSTSSDAALADIKIGYDGTTYDTPGDAVRGQIGLLSEDLAQNIELVAKGNITLNMEWVQGYWYAVDSGIYGAAVPAENFVACKEKIVGDGRTLEATKKSALGLTLFVCEYDANETFIRGYQYGNSTLKIVLEIGKKYAFSVSSNNGVTPTSVSLNYPFVKILNIVDENEILKDYIKNHDIYYIGQTRKLKTLKEGLEIACQHKDSIVYVDEGTYDIIEEYGEEYFKNYVYSANDCGIILKNNVNVIFSPNTKVICNYTGDNHDIMFYFSPFNVGVGGFRVENLNIECSRVRYCVHDDLGMFGNSHDFTKTEYQNCNMYLDNSQNTARESYNCIGGGLPYNGEVVINGCIFESTAVSPKYGGVDYHQNGANGAKSKSLITNCYFKGRMDRYSCSNLGQTEEISTVIVTNCSCGRTEGYADNENYSNSINFLAWNNIRRPD